MSSLAYGDITKESRHKKMFLDNNPSNWDFEAKAGEKTFGNIKVRVLNSKKLRVFKNNEKVFGADCSDIAACTIYTTNSKTPIYEYKSGNLKLGGNKPGSIYKLALNNIQEHQPSKHYNDKYISFIVITSGGSAGSQRGRYDIHTEHGWIELEETNFDWYRYGRKKDYP